MKLLAAGVLFLLCVGYFAFSGVSSNDSGGGNNDTIENNTVEVASNSKDVMEGAIRLFNDVEMPRLFGDDDRRRNAGKEAIKRLRTFDTRGCSSDFRKAFEKCRKSKVKRVEASAEYQYRGQAYSMDKLDAEYSELCQELEMICKKYNLRTMPDQEDRPVEAAPAEAPYE